MSIDTLRAAVGSEAWETFRDRESGRVYYANRITGEAAWQPPPPPTPLNPYPYDDLIQAWRAYRSPAHVNELFFLNSLSNERSWIRPYGFYGMPQGEPEDHEKGPWIQYVDNEDRLYFYNPRTKLCVRRHQRDTMSEEAAYQLLRERGELWDGVPRQGEEERASESISSSSSSSYSSSASSDSDDENSEDPLKTSFRGMLTRKGVSKVSKWVNWIAKISSEPEFQEAPAEKVREWFEDHVKSLISGDASTKANIISRLIKDLGLWLKTSHPKGNELSLEDIIESVPSEIQSDLRGMNATEKQSIVTQARKLALS